MSNQIHALMRRYKDAYLVARSTNGFGIVIKAIGLIVGALFVGGGLFLANEGRGAEVLGIAAVGVGIVVGVLFYLLGVLVSAQGQILKASLDAAVNTSPFLTNADRATVMSLPQVNSNEGASREAATTSIDYQKQQNPVRTTPEPKKAAVDASGFSWDDL